MPSNENNPPKKETPMTNTPKPIITTEDFGNGIFINWKIPPTK